MNKLPLLDDLHVVTTIQQLGSFAAAARQLGMSAAYISKRVKLLEQQLQVQIFLRNGRTLSLTPQGEVVINHAEVMLDAIKAMQAELAQQQVEPTGRFRLVTSTGFGMAKISPLLIELKQQFAGLRFELELLDRPVDLVAEGFDLEIKVGGELPTSLIAQKLLTNSRVLCVAPSYIDKNPLASEIECLSDHACIVIHERDQLRNFWRLTHANSEKKVAFNPVFTTNNGEVAKAWCLAGEGIMLRSQWSVQHELETGQLVQIYPEYSQPADVFAVHPTRTERFASLKAVITALKEMLNRSK